jgi:hypothetical protein
MGSSAGGFERDQQLKPKRRARHLLTLMVLAPVYGLAVADNSKAANPAADADLLEFLGSVDSGVDSQAADDGSWIDYLSQTDIGKVAKTADPNGAPRPKQASGAKSPAPGDKNNE